MIAYALAVVAASIPQPDPCEAVDQLLHNNCVNISYKRADKELNGYYAAAISRLKGDDDKESLPELIAAQKSWIAYRDSECSAVYDFYDGSIGNERAIECQERLTKARTAMIWQNWLTYEDSTPPVLPRPDISD